MIEEGWIDLLITAAVMGGETRGQRLIAGMSDKKAEQGRGTWRGEAVKRMKEDGGRREQRKGGEDEEEGDHGELSW